MCKVSQSVYVCVSCGNTGYVAGREASEESFRGTKRHLVVVMAEELRGAPVTV